MGGWSAAIARRAAGVERVVDLWRRRLQERLSPHRPLRVISYLGYGARDRVHLPGRVLSGVVDLSPAAATDSAWANLLRTVRRFRTQEVPGVRVKASLGTASAEAVTDEEGYFDLVLTPDEPLPPTGGWHPVEVSLVRPGKRAVETRPARVLVPPEDGRLVVVSDLDDTVIHADATSLWKMARTVVLGNARTRMPFAGVAPFYRALALGDDDAPRNALFYVSSSPWNLYDPLVEFLALHEIPVGPLFLRDWGLTESELLPTSHGDHKLEALRRLLTLYPDRRFLLIGDCGQEDPEIYCRAVAENPGRIAAVYIRNLPLEDVARPEAVRGLAEEVRRAGSELLLVDTTFEAAEHAASRGWISRSALGDVARAVGKDLAPPEDEEVDLVVPEDRPSHQEAGEPEAKDLAADPGPRPPPRSGPPR